MNAQWIALIAQIGLEKAYLIWLTWQDKNEVTSEMWDAVLERGTKPISKYIEEELARRAALGAVQ